uniref:Uncharacterized protein n=1 Tax=Arundo donax TaxID=35708 RepID=A0A0A8YHB4_ARUDO
MLRRCIPVYPTHILLFLIERTQTSSSVIIHLFLQFSQVGTALRTVAQRLQVPRHVQQIIKKTDIT